jgi:hypothetical protein
MSEYQKQANEFLSKNHITFKAKFLKNDYHFQEDKNTRDIFNVTFSREGKRFSLRFGQSINESTGNGDNLPTPYDVLACIQKYEVGSFENFCGDFGYDIDSRPAEKIYKGVSKEWEKVNSFFSESELAELKEIQ